MNRFSISAVVVGAGVLFSSLVSFAGAQNQPAAQPNRYGERDPYGTINGNIQAAGASDFPAAFVAAVPEAKARSAAASAMYDRATSDMGITIRRLQRAYENTPEMQAALDEEREAGEQYRNATTLALQPVNESEEARAIHDLRTEIGRKIERQRSSSQVDEQQIVALATLKLEVAKKIREKESLALAGDPAVIRAHARYMLAARKVGELRERNSEQVRNHPDVLAARKALEDARVIRLATAAYLDGAVRAANIALNYASNLHRWDNLRYAGSGGYYAGSYWGAPYYTSSACYDPFYATRRY